MTITYLGHAAFLLSGEKNIIIDPFLKENPQAALTVERLPKIDFVLVTHDHDDHLGDAVTIAKKHNATLLAIFELATSDDVRQSGIKAEGMNIGGTYRQNNLAISMTQALHSATLGDPAGFVVEMEGKRVYHAGDTGLFSDMALIPKIFGSLDIALLPIGGYFVMDVKQAAMAVKLLYPKFTVPMHYNTWPIIAARPEAFLKACEPHRVKILRPGEQVVI